MIRSPLIQPKPSKTAKLVSSAPPSLPMRPELKNSNSKKCGSLLTEPSETTLEEQSSESQFSARISQDSSKTGQNQSLLADTHTEMFTTALISSYLKPEICQLISREESKTSTFQSTNSQVQELLLSCSTTTIPSQISPTHHSNTPFKETTHCI